MATQHAIDEAGIRRRIGKWTEAICARDLDGVMSLYAPHIVSFDLDPPLQYTGVEAKRKRWLNVFAMYQRVLGYEVRNLTFVTSRSPWVMTSHSVTASIESAAY